MRMLGHFLHPQCVGWFSEPRTHGILAAKTRGKAVDQVRQSVGGLTIPAERRALPRE